MLRFPCAAFLWVFAWSLASTPAELAQAPSFDVVSIRPVQPYPPYPGFFIEGDRFRGNHATAAMVIAAAHGDIHRSQIIGGPPWIDTDRYNIEARADRRLPPKADDGLPQPVVALLGKVLVDRFQFRAHLETREMDVLVLTRAEPEIRFNEHLRPSRRDCTSVTRPDWRSPDLTSADPIAARFFDCYERGSYTTLIVRGRPMDRLAERLRGELRRMVINETDIDGNVDIDVEYGPFEPDVLTRQAAMITALREQLGLSLESQTRPLPVVVIERIERPSPD